MIPVIGYINGKETLIPATSLGLIASGAVALGVALIASGAAAALISVAAPGGGLRGVLLREGQRREGQRQACRNGPAT